MAVDNGVAFIVAGMAMTTLIALLRKMRSGVESTENKCDDQVVEKADRIGEPKTERRSCKGCPDCEITLTPDSDDWFCDDDVAVLCKAVAGGRVMVEHIRPYLVHERCPVPSWCPKRKAGIR